jgi:hypothetical protein
VDIFKLQKSNLKPEEKNNTSDRSTRTKSGKLNAGWQLFTGHEILAFTRKFKICWRKVGLVLLGTPIGFKKKYFKNFGLQTGTETTIFTIYHY